MCLSLSVCYAVVLLMDEGFGLGCDSAGVGDPLPPGSQLSHYACYRDRLMRMDILPTRANEAPRQRRCESSPNRTLTGVR